MTDSEKVRAPPLLLRLSCPFTAPHMPNRRSIYLPLFRSRSPLTYGISSRRKRFIHGALSDCVCSRRTAFFLLVSATISIGLFMAFLQTLPRPPVSLNMANISRVRRRAPPTSRQAYYRPPLSSESLFPFLPDPGLTDWDKIENFHQQFLSQDTLADHDAITAILPVTSRSLNELQANLDSLLSVRSSILREIIIVCRPRIVLRTERALKNARTSLGTSSDAVLTVLQSSPSDSQSLSVLHVISSVLTSRVLLLETTALRHVDSVTRMTLLDAALSAVPVGPCGVVISPTNTSCVCSSERAVPVAYLVPPILSPTSLLVQAENGMRLNVETWAALGERIVKIGKAGLGGVVLVSPPTQSRRSCTDAMSSINRYSESAFLKAFYKLLEQNHVAEKLAPLRINILLPDREDLESFGTTACEMARRGSVLRIMLFSWSHSDLSTRFALDVGCHLHFETIPLKYPTSMLINRLKGWIQTDGETPTVLIYASRLSTQTLAIEASVETLRLTEIPVICLPVGDLPFCEWMSVLGVPEWKNWQKPRIDLSVITNDRPRSLARLLASLTAARYYGDPVHLKINLDQTADAETRRSVTHFRWDSGTLHVQHRVIAAGLLPAVTEAWYPHDNDSYGVLLEDDVELSPMFYAWIKMSVLKYRYSPLKTQSRTLFGVSLYQPTNLELRVEGRVPFEPRMIFAEDSHTPYLSQVPCSWGAVYFPEHFVEFHDYLALRLSEVTHDISTAIIPDIRSNRWKRSWKKYFNELVYLRGYVMLYPNYDLSLATNHAERGAHVKTRASHIHDSIKRQFEVPLMPLPPVSATDGSSTAASLLDLPTGSLPSWDNLPVLDLWGSVTSHRELTARGQQRHELVSGCPSLRYSVPFRHDATELLCAR